MPDPLVELLTMLNRNLERFLEQTLPSPEDGLFDRFRAFRVSARGFTFHVEGITHPDDVRFRELLGIDHLIETLRRNTEQFLRGAPCNHVLLYGPRGTGKSSAVKALLNEYGDQGLRVVEITKEALLHFGEIASLVEERTERFLLFCDDLAFDEEDRSFRELKAVLEGGLARRPANVLLCATSNRRHLMREFTGDNLPVRIDDELHPGETMEEKVSLSDRFGIRLGFPRFDKDTYLGIVANYSRLRGLDTDAEETAGEALRWARTHGSFSGRTARQFVDDLEGRCISAPEA